LKFATDLIVVGLEEPESLNGLDVFVDFEFLEHDFVLGIVGALLCDSHKVSALNMCKPNNGTKCIISLFLLQLIVVMQNKLRLVIQSEHCPFPTRQMRPLRTRDFHLSSRDVPQFCRVYLRRYVNVFAKLYF
jgi:hypothetical protein